MIYYWATNAGAGTKAGTSLANAAVVDPADANDIWAIINALGALTDDITIKLCGDASITATCEITKDATAAFTIIVQGRNAGDTADAEVEIDAGNGAFSVFTLTAADFWDFRQVYATNTSEAAGMDGWLISVNADGVAWYKCRASYCYRGWDFASGGKYGRLLLCHAHDNAEDGIRCEETTSCVFCQSMDNGGDGYYWGTQIGCLAAGNGIGFHLCKCPTFCTAYNNGGDGFAAYEATAVSVVACIAESNGCFGFGAGTATLLLLRCADYVNTSGRVSGGNVLDLDGVSYTASAFVDAGNGDFALNDAVHAWGALLKGLSVTLLDGLTTTYLTCGLAAAGLGNLLVHPGMTGGING